MSDSSINELIDKLQKKIKQNRGDITCLNRAKLLPKLYNLGQSLAIKCSMEELSFGLNIVFDNMLNDIIKDPIKKTKAQFNKIYGKFFFTIPQLLKKLKLHIKNPEFMKEFGPLIDPFIKSLMKYMCEKYGPERVEKTLNDILGNIGNSIITGMSNGFHSIPGISALASAGKGIADGISSGTRIFNKTAKFIDEPPKELENMENTIKKFDKKEKQKGGAKKNKVIKKYSKLLSLILTHLLMKYCSKNKTIKKRKKSKKHKKSKKRKKRKRRKTAKLNKNKSTKSKQKKKI